MGYYKCFNNKITFDHFLIFLLILLSVLNSNFLNYLEGASINYFRHEDFSDVSLFRSLVIL